MTTKTFAEEYLDILNKCYNDIQNLKNSREILNLFGQQVVLTNEEVSDIIYHCVEEYENTLYVEFNDTYLELDNYCLFREEYLPDNLDPNQFMLNMFDDLKELTKKQRKQVFNYIQEKDLLKHFSGLYYTALESYYESKYKKEYEELKTRYPGLLFYPDFQFETDEDSYYESSRC